MMTGFIVRPFEASRTGERNWILKSWLVCDCCTSSARAEGDRHAHLARQRAARILSDPSVTILVACSDQDHDALAGFIIFSGNTLHYIYVRKAAQGLGLAHELCSHLPPGDIATTHQPLDSRPLPAGWSYQGYPT